MTEYTLVYLLQTLEDTLISSPLTSDNCEQIAVIGPTAVSVGDRQFIGKHRFRCDPAE